MFPEYSKNIPQMSVSELFQRDPWNIVMSWKCFYEAKKFEKLFCELSSENFNIGSLLSWNVFLNFTKTVFHWEQGAYSNALKRFVLMLGSWKKLELAQHHYQSTTLL